MKDPNADVDLERRAVVKGLAALTAASAFWPRELLAGAQLQRGPTALVIGAGIAGLSAAYELRNAGFNVSIFEKEKFTGGRMVELQMGPLYQFTHAVGVLEANREMFALAAELGIKAELEGDPNSPDDYTTDNGYGVYATGLRFRIDEVMKIPGLSAETRKRLPLLQADLDEIRQQVDPCLLATGTGYDHETLGDYYERKLGKAAADELIRYWIEPACSAWGWPVFETSKIALLSWFAQQQADFVLPRGGIGVLTRKLGSILPVQNNTTVRYIAPADTTGRHTVHYLTPDLQRRSLTPDIVVLAVEGKYLDKLVQEPTPEQRAFSKNIFFTKEAIVCYILDEKHAPKEYQGGAYTPSHPDPIKAKTTYWFVTPGGAAFGDFPPHARYALSRQDTPVWQVSGKTIDDYCFPMMKHFYPELNRRIVSDIVNYTCDDLIYMPVGYVRQMADVLREQNQGRRGLYFAGEYVAGAHTGAACASGRSVSRQIIKHWA
jgi:oxygen-dependent protoporphyrinogen oxidase